MCMSISTIMRASTNKDGVWIPHFEKIDESEAQNNITALKHLLVNSHDVAAIKRKLKGQLTSEHIFGLCKTFKNY